MKVLLYSPLEQFDVILVNFIFGLFDIANMEWSLVHVLFILVLIASYMAKNDIFFVDVVQYHIELVYQLIAQMVEQQATAKAYVYFPYIFVVFIFIGLADTVGMLPFGFTLTAHLCITFFLAFAFNSAYVLIGLSKHKAKFFELFVPNDAPKPLVPLIVVIEVVSYLIRSFSLAIRLFANMMAGHCLLYVISMFAFGFIENALFMSLGPVTLVYAAIFVLEFSIAFLQAYVFAILLCIYLKDSLHPGH